MDAQDLRNIQEAYSQVYSQPQELTEEVEIAAQYFYEAGLNEDGVDILIEELGVEEFVGFVYDIAEEYLLTEARAGGAKIEPKLASGKAIQGKPKAASLKRLRAQKAERQESEKKASSEKPSGMKASLQRQSAVANAKKQQPKKRGILDRIAGAVNKGIERHNAAMDAARETGKTISKASKKIGGVAREVGKGASGAARLAGHVARKGLSDEYLMGYLIDEGYAETQEAAYAILENMGEEWKQSIVEAGENIGREPKTVGGRERSGVPGETYAERQQRMKPKPVKEARYYGGRRGPDRNAVGGADRDDSPRYRNLGSPTPRQEAEEKGRADAAAKRAVAQSRRRRAAERGQNNG